MKPISFIGTGNMATAIIGGMLSAGTDPKLIYVYDKLADKAEALASARGLNIAPSLQAAYESGELILLAVKPQNFAEVLGELRESGVCLDGKTFISIAAGISTTAIEKMLCRECAVVRVMPNTPLMVGKGASALCRNPRVCDEDFLIACSIFESAGMIMVIDESQMNTVICANGSSPAYFYYFIDAVVRSAMAQGLDLDERTVLEAVCQTVIGSAQMLLDSGKTAGELTRAVTSPKGTTERAMNVLYDEKVDEIIDRAMRACTARAEEMAKEFGA